MFASKKRSLIGDVGGIILDVVTVVRLMRGRGVDVFRSERFGQTLFFPITARGKAVAAETFVEPKRLLCYTVPASVGSQAHDTLHHNGCGGIGAKSAFGAIFIDT